MYPTVPINSASSQPGWGGGMPADSEGTRGCFAGGGAESPGGQREGVPGFTSALRERFPKVNTGRSLPGKREA